MTTGLGATFTIEGNPGKDVGTAKTYCRNQWSSPSAETSGPRHLCGCIGNCQSEDGRIHLLMYKFQVVFPPNQPYLSTYRTKRCSKLRWNSMGRLLNLQQNTACWQHNLTISRLSCEDCLFVIASSSAMMFSTSIHIC